MVYILRTLTQKRIGFRLIALIHLHTLKPYLMAEFLFVDHGFGLCFYMIFDWIITNSIYANFTFRFQSDRFFNLIYSQIIEYQRIRKVKVDEIIITQYEYFMLFNCSNRKKKLNIKEICYKKIQQYIYLFNNKIKSDMQKEQKIQQNFEDFFSNFQIDDDQIQDKSDKSQEEKDKQKIKQKCEVKQPLIRSLDTKEKFLAQYAKSYHKDTQNKWTLQLIDCELQVSLLKEIPQNQLKYIEMLNLQKNYIRDSGLAKLTEIQFPNIERLLLGDNGLQNIKGIGKFNKLRLLHFIDDDFDNMSNMLNQQAALEIISTKWQNLWCLSIEFKMPNPNYEGWMDLLSEQDHKAWKIFISNNFQSFPKLQRLYLKDKNIGSLAKQGLKKANQKFTNNRIKIDIQNN